MNRKQIKFSDSEKRRIIEFYQESGLSKLEVQRHFKIKGHSKIKEWMYHFGIREDTELMKKASELKRNPQVSKSLDPDERIKELEAALAHEKLRRCAYETMIDIAEKRFNIDIRKKPGTKQ